MKKLFALAVLALIAGNVEGMRSWKHCYKRNPALTLEELKNLQAPDDIKNAQNILNASKTWLLNKTSKDNGHLLSAAGFGLATVALGSITINAWQTARSSSDHSKIATALGFIGLAGYGTFWSLMKTAHHWQKAIHYPYFVEGRLSRNERMQEALRSNPNYERGAIKRDFSSNSNNNSDDEGESALVFSDNE